MTETSRTSRTITASKRADLRAHTARLDAATARLDTPDDATAADAMTAMAAAVDALHGLSAWRAER